MNTVIFNFNFDITVENDTSEQLVSIENWSEECHGVFRVKASISNVFVFGEAGGIVESCTAVEFPVSLKHTLPEDFASSSEISVSITVEVVPFSEEYDDLGAKAFWATHAKNACKKIASCVVKKSSRAPMLADRAETMVDSCPLTGFEDPDEEEAHLTGILEEDENVGDASEDNVEPVAVTSQNRPPMPMLSELQSRQTAENNGLKHNSPPKPSRRHSMHDTPVGNSLFDELKQTQESLQKGEKKLQHVHTKTAAEKEQERLDSLMTVPEGGFTNIMDELKHFSYMLNQNVVEVTNDSAFVSSEDNEVAEDMVNEHAVEMIEKDNQITELTAEIHRLLDQHERDLASANEQKSTRIAALEKQNESRIATLNGEHEAQLKQIADENASRLSSLTEQYESRVSALNKQLEEKGGQEELLEQQRVMMEAFTVAKDNEIKDTLMHQELKYKTMMETQDHRIEDLTLELESLKKEKEEEIARLTEHHDQKLKKMLDQQAINVKTLNNQMESALKASRDRNSALSKELNDTRQNKSAEIMSIKQQCQDKLNASVARYTEAVSMLQSENDDLKQRMQNMEWQLKMKQDELSSLQLQTSFQEPQVQLQSPPPPPHMMSNQSSQHQIQSNVASMSRPASLPVTQTSPVASNPLKSSPQALSNPFLANPSAGRMGPRPAISTPHYTTSVRQLRRPDRVSSTRDFLVNTQQPLPSSAPQQQLAPVPLTSDAISVGPSVLRFIGKYYGYHPYQVNVINVFSWS